MRDLVLLGPVILNADVTSMDRFPSPKEPPAAEGDPFLPGSHQLHSSGFSEESSLWREPFGISKPNSVLMTRMGQWALFLVGTPATW